MGFEVEDNKILEYKIYIEERKSLIDAKIEGARLFDKAILTLSGGAFGLSLTFIRQVVPDVSSQSLYILGLAWGGFCISMLFTLISFLTSQNACEKQIEILEAVYLSNQSIQKNKYADWTKRLNILSIVAFIIGAIALGIFSFINLLP